MGAAHYAVAEQTVTFLGDRTGITAEAEVRKGVIVTPPPPLPIKTDRECGAAVRTVGTEVFWHRKN